MLWTINSCHGDDSSCPPTEVAEAVFNRCTETNATNDGTIRPDSPDYQVTFNYEFLEDFRDPVTAAEQFQRALTKKCVLGPWLPPSPGSSYSGDSEGLLCCSLAAGT